METISTISIWLSNVYSFAATSFSNCSDVIFASEFQSGAMVALQLPSDKKREFTQVDLFSGWPINFRQQVLYAWKGFRKADWF